MGPATHGPHAKGTHQEMVIGPNMSQGREQVGRTSAQGEDDHHNASWRKSQIGAQAGHAETNNVF